MKRGFSPTWASPWAHLPLAAALCAFATACGLSGVGGDLPGDVAGTIPEDAAADVAEVDAAGSDADAAANEVDVAEVAGTDAAVGDGLDAAEVAGTDAAISDALDAADVEDTSDAGPFVDTNAPTDVGCWADNQCDDGDACTADKCDATFGCQHTVTVCDDQNACTNDSCDVNLGCQHTPTVCDDTNACTTDSCDVSLGCQHTPTVCDDTNACTNDSCDVSLGCDNTPTVCDDNSACTTDACDPSTGCVFTPFDVSTTCSDANACTLDACDTGTGCVHLPLDGTLCDDSDPCTSEDVCVGKTCAGQVTRWQIDLAVPSGVGRWVGVAPRKDGTRLFIGWQRISESPNQMQVVVQRVSPSGALLGGVEVKPTAENIVVDSVAVHGTDVLVHGHTMSGSSVGQAWYGLLDDTDTFKYSGLYEPQNDVWNGGVPRAAFGKTIQPKDGSAPFTRWYTSIDSAPDVQGVSSHQFYTIDSGGKPHFHSLGDANSTCGALLIRDGLMVGVCDSKTTTDYFRATFTDEGKIKEVTRPKQPVPFPFKPFTAVLRPDGHVWYLKADGVVSVDPAGIVVSLTSMTIGKSALVYGAAPDPDGAVWLFGTNGSEATLWRADESLSIVETRTFGVGALVNGFVDKDGIWLAGANTQLNTPWPSASTGGLVARADLWGKTTCNPNSVCAVATTCSDGNPCTNDWCEGNCQHWLKKLCDDAFPCTIDDTCTSGQCDPGTPKGCDDNNSCTLDACDATGCVHTPTNDYQPCEDNSSCTTMDRCIAGTCEHLKLSPPKTACGVNSACVADGRCIEKWASHLVAGSTHTCAVQADGRIHCWGDNNFNQLGSGYVSASYIPLEVPGSSNWAPTNVVLGAGNGFNIAWIGGYGQAMGWGLSDVAQANIDLSSSFYKWPSTPEGASTGLTEFTSVGLGNHHGCALLKTGEVKCWGKSDFGQVAGVSQTGTTAVTVSGLGTVQSIAVGGNNSCVVQSDGTVLCWGEMAGAWHTGKLSDGASSTPVTISGLGAVKSIAIGTSHGCAIMQAGSVKCWGANDSGQLGAGQIGSPSFAGATLANASNLKQIVAGDAFTCGLSAMTDIVCWGAGTAGQMGDGLNVSRTEALVVPDLATGMEEVVAGGQHACARRFDGAVFCWGTNGIPGMAASPVPVAVPDSLP